MMRDEWGRDFGSRMSRGMYAAGSIGRRRKSRTASAASGKVGETTAPNVGKRDGIRGVRMGTDSRFEMGGQVQNPETLQRSQSRSEMLRRAAVEKRTRTLETKNRDRAERAGYVSPQANTSGSGQGASAKAMSGGNGTAGAIGKRGKGGQRGDPMPMQMTAAGRKQQELAAKVARDAKVHSTLQSQNRDRAVPNSLVGKADRNLTQARTVIQGRGGSKVVSTPGSKVATFVRGQGGTQVRVGTNGIKQQGTPAVYKGQDGKIRRADSSQLAEMARRDMAAANPDLVAKARELKRQRKSA